MQVRGNRAMAAVSYTNLFDTQQIMTMDCGDIKSDTTCGGSEGPYILLLCTSGHSIPVHHRQCQAEAS